MKRVWWMVVAMAAATASADAPRVVGYYPSWVGDEYPPEKIDYAKFTHLCHAFLPVDREGQAKFEGTVPSRTLTGLAHAAGVKVILSFGGENSGRRYNPLSRSAAKRAAFVRHAMTIVEAYDYDGLDNDWEFPENATDRENYARLNRELRAALDRLGAKLKRRLLLTAALPTGDWAGKWYPVETIKATDDFVNVMTYDFAGPWSEVAGHNAPLTTSSRDPEGGCVQAAMAYWVGRGLPKDRLNLGLPNFGHGFDVKEPYMKVTRGAHSKVSDLDYREAVQLIAQGWTRTVDAETGAPWLYAPDRSAVFGYDDPDSLARKVRWGKAEGFGGIFFWDMNADRLPDGSHPLTNAAVAALRQP